MSDSPLSRERSLVQVKDRRDPWDVVIIGGGATGIGAALDAVTRGLSVALFEQSDFGKGTSSRSTKLIHGGVRYLAQGNLSLVREALQERAILLRNAPGLVHGLPFVIPASGFAEAAWYRTGIALYDGLAGSASIGESRWLSRAETLKTLPGIRRDGIRAGVLFYDGQFDDARLLIAMAVTAAKHGAVLLNYAPVARLLTSTHRVTGVAVCDAETGQEYEIAARVVINAAGAWTDDIRHLASEPSDEQRRLRVSRGSHIVLDRSFLPSSTALLIPKTPDNRVLFAIPWLGSTLVGTTDVETDHASLEPRASQDEIRFLLETAGRFLAKRPERRDIRSVWAGVRPLIGADSSSSARLSREHVIFTDREGLITIAGGKWTTYRRMAQDVIDATGLTNSAGRTASLRLDGIHQSSGEEDLQQATTRAVSEESARTVEDVLARRTRLLFLDAEKAIARASDVARWMAQQLGRDEEWRRDQEARFAEVAAGYRAS